MGIFNNIFVALNQNKSNNDRYIMNDEINEPRQTRSLVGQIPDPEELYGREDFIDNIWRLIEGNNILLLAPRRFGKSGVMRHVLLRPRTNYLPLSFELEDVDSPEEFVWRVTRELLKHDTLQSLLSKAKRLPKAFTIWVKSNFDEAEFEGAKIKFKAQIKEDWREAAKRMLSELEKADKTIIFLFDEFPAMLDRLIEKTRRTHRSRFFGMGSEQSGWNKRMFSVATDLSSREVSALTKFSASWGQPISWWTFTG